MVLIEPTPNRLSVSYSPRFFLAFYMLFTLVMVILAARDKINGTGAPMVLLLLGGGIGLGAMILFIEGTQLELDRAEGTVTIRTRKIFGNSSQTLQIADVVRAVSHMPDKRYRNRRPAFLLRDGRLVNTRKVVLDHKTSQQIVDALNDWLGVDEAASAAASEA